MKLNLAGVEGFEPSMTESKSVALVQLGYTPTEMEPECRFELHGLNMDHQVQLLLIRTVSQTDSSGKKYKLSQPVFWPSRAHRTGAGAASAAATNTGAG